MHRRRTPRTLLSHAHRTRPAPPRRITRGERIAWTTVEVLAAALRHRLPPPTPEASPLDLTPGAQYRRRTKR